MSTNKQPIFQEYVTPEEVNALPLTYYEGEIVLVDEAAKVQAAVAEINKFPVIGFDTETKPTFVKGQFYHISLIQLAIPGKVFLFRINHTGFSKGIIDLFSNKNITGCALKNMNLHTLWICPSEYIFYNDIKHMNINTLYSNINIMRDNTTVYTKRKLPFNKRNRTR